MKKAFSGDLFLRRHPAYPAARAKSVHLSAAFANIEALMAEMAEVIASLKVAVAA